MRTERTFLMELFLDDDLPKPIKIKIKERFEEMEAVPVHTSGYMTTRGPELTTAASNQSPSMQRIMQQNPDLIRPPQPVTPAAAQALAKRQALLQSAGSEKPESGRKAPRKI